MHNGKRASADPLVLIIDDHRDTREMYAQVLELYGYSTSEAGNGFEALERANAAISDVIVTDVGLPGMDGIELCRRLRADEATSRIPIIALTGFSQAAVAERARTLGIAKILVKPCSPDLLLAEIEAVCPRNRRPPSAV